MAHKRLANYYRPQNFSQVLGQEQIRKILSRAAGEGKVAPAYMFSGTRGVGKTTIARIFAKAINCHYGPAEEPCNTCRLCQQITKNSCLDVSEIDGASHTGVDHVRKLNEEVEYAPLECRYKVVIIDEAHMLSRSAFNALLKTLEEPPAHAVFILATTEPHKFPATIVSRCQHYAFKRLAQKDLESYMAFILDTENVVYESGAISLLARKGGGSVRDSLSILSQLMALGENSIQLSTVRDVLGIIGHETMQGLMEAFSSKQSMRLVQYVSDLFDQGLDIGFFLQELAMAWRNIFLLKQTGEQGLSLLDLPQEEAVRWLKWSRYFPLSYIHAAWQLTLEGQKRVMTSVDPSLSLELLLLNIAFLPDLMPIDDFEEIDQSDFGHQNSEQGGAEKWTTGSDKSSIEKGAKEEKLAQSLNSTGCVKTWDGFIKSLKNEKNESYLPNLHCVKSVFRQERLELYCPNFLSERLQENRRYETLKEKLQEYFDNIDEVVIYTNEQDDQSSYQDWKERVLNKPLVQDVMQEFQAKIVDIKPRESSGGLKE